MIVIGVALVLAGVALLVAEAHLPAGWLGVIGGVAVAGGAALAIGGAGAGLAVILPVTLAVCAVVGVWLVVLARTALESQRLRASSGREALNGRMGVVRTWTDGAGQVFVDGALWRACESWGREGEEIELGQGDPVVVESVRGLTLAVRPAEEWEKQ